MCRMRQHIYSAGIPKGHPDMYGSYLAYISSKKEKYHKRKKPVLIKRNSNVFYR